MTRTPRRLRPLAAAAACVALIAATAPVAQARPAAAPAAPAAPRSKATFGIGPSDGTRLDRRASLDFLASPGARLSDHVAVVNLADRPVSLQLYTADAASSADGTIGYQPRAARRLDAATWITPGGRGTVTLRARQTVVLPVTVRVPQDATPGDHVAGIVASLTSTVTGGKGQRIAFEQRVALRASFRISGALRPALSVQDVHAGYSGSLNPFGSGTASVTYTVRNTGNVALAARQAVSVSGLFGEDTAAGVPDLPLLLPRASVRMRVTVPGVLPQVRLTGHVSLHPVAAAGAADPGLPHGYEGTAAFWAVPWSLLALIVLLAAAAVTARILRRRAHRARRAAHAVGSGRHRPALST